MISRLLHPFLQIEHGGYVESVGEKLSLYRFKRFDLVICWLLRYPRISVTFHAD
jgi:hypothetical protein